MGDCKGGHGKRQLLCTVAENAPIAAGTWRLALECEAGATAGFVPGQFVNVMVPGFYLRRPLALCLWDDKGFSLVYKVAGQGTLALTQVKPGAVLDVLAPLGNGFALPEAGAAERVLLVGGGCGVVPLVALAVALKAAGHGVAVALGFAGADDAYLIEELRAASDAFYLATVDGTLGAKGFVTAVLDDAAAGCSRFYACGPAPMLRAVCAALPLPGQVSLEERMACGFGGCMGCAIETKDGMKRVCADGPVFEREVLGW